MGVSGERGARVWVCAHCIERSKRRPPGSSSPAGCASQERVSLLGWSMELCDLADSEVLTFFSALLPLTYMTVCV